VARAQRSPGQHAHTPAEESAPAVGRLLRGGQRPAENSRQGLQRQHCGRGGQMCDGHSRRHSQGVQAVRQHVPHGAARADEGEEAEHCGGAARGLRRRLALHQLREHRRARGRHSGPQDAGRAPADGPVLGALLRHGDHHQLAQEGVSLC